MKNYTIYKMYTNKNKEWERLLEKPDNIIVSDSLRDKLSPQDLEVESQQIKIIDIMGYVHFENYVLEGKLVNYNHKNSHISFSLEGPLEKFVHVLYNGTIQEINIYDSISDNSLQILMLPEDDVPEWELNCEDEHNTILTVTVKKTA